MQLWRCSPRLRQQAETPASRQPLAWPPLRVFHGRSGLCIFYKLCITDHQVHRVVCWWPGRLGSPCGVGSSCSCSRLALSWGVGSRLGGRGVLLPALLATVARVSSVFSPPLRAKQTYHTNTQNYTWRLAPGRLLIPHIYKCISAPLYVANKRLSGPINFVETMIV